MDLPQHLHLISVLHRLDDATTLFPELFARRPELTPYLGYYYAVSLLNWLLPLELANKVFLSAYVVGLPLSLAFLLRSLKRPAWPALLAIPFAYGDSFAWGFINYIAALPLTLLTCGLFVRAIQDVQARRRWAIGLGFSLVAVLLMHVQAFAYLGVALPFLLLTTSAPEGKTWRARRHALYGVVPGVAMFVIWVGLRLGQPAEIAPGQPWKSWGPLLSKENLSWKTFDQNLGDLVGVLTNLLPDGTDRLGMIAVIFAAAFGLLAVGAKLEWNRRLWLGLAVIVLPPLLLAMSRHPELGVSDRFAPVLLAEAWFPWVMPVMLGVLALAALLTGSRESEEGAVGRWRIFGLAALALLLYFALPFDIRGYMYYLNTRYAHLAAPLLLACLPPIAVANRRAVLAAALIAAAVAGLTLARGFSKFDDEAKNLTALADYTAPKPRVMGLIWNTGSAAVTHPLFLHSSTVLARLRGGVTNFSFALTPHSPVMYRGAPPPTFPSEWNPNQMSWEQHGRWYDHFVVRGPHPRQIFGQLLDSGELYIAAQSGDFWLVRKK